MTKSDDSKTIFSNFYKLFLAKATTKKLSNEALLAYKQEIETVTDTLTQFPRQIESRSCNKNVFGNKQKSEYLDKLFVFECTIFESDVDKPQVRLSELDLLIMGNISLLFIIPVLNQFLFFSPQEINGKCREDSGLGTNLRLEDMLSLFGHALDPWRPNKRPIWASS